ncbi:hypothetical protein N7E02_08110 [Aliirhizobium terrae]|uniref:hypothetical protein n=1 Tax=Terrirhizobium terrae TaxID=2926709 RepID=UPI002577178B|nr:hypothetical protein [Rhizobium sp. CC-CFT758]WJH40568.1 hypothetical protein N7E02_08110 [Rhizobium sp. CC-CFT758]
MLFRATSENGHQSPYFVSQLLGMNGHIKPTPYALAGRELDCQLIADVLGLPSGTSVSSLLHEQVDSAGTRVNFFGRDVRRKNFFEHQRRVSPRSLRRSNYQKAIWSVQGISFDPTTREKLLIRCPACDGALPFNKTYGVEQCANCFLRDGVITDFRDYSCDLINVDDNEALDIAVELVNPEVSVSDIDCRLIHDDLRRFGPGQLFELISSLAFYKNFLIHDSGRTPLATRLGLPHAHDLAEAARALINWPKGFAAYSEKLRAWQTQKLERCPSQSVFPPSYPVRSVVTMLEPDLQRLLKTVALAGRDETVMMTLSEAAVSVDEHQQSRNLAEAFWHDGRIRFGKHGLESAVRTVRRIAPAASAADLNFVMLSSSNWLRKWCRRVRLPVCFVGDLISSNLLEGVDPLLDRLSERAGEVRSVRLEERLEDVVLKVRAPRKAIALYVAIAALAPRDVNPWPTVLTAILDHELTVWKHGKADSFTYFRVADFDKLGAVISRARLSTSLGRLPADRTAVMSVLGLTKSTLQSVRQRKFLQDQLTLSDLWSYRDLYLSSTELRTRMAMCDNEELLPTITASLEANTIPCVGAHKKGRIVVFGSAKMWKTFSA